MTQLAEKPTQETHLDDDPYHISSLPNHTYGSSDELLYQYQGFWYYKWELQAIITLQQKLTNVDQLCDVVLATLPKSGTTWFKALIFTIINRAKFSTNPNPLTFTSPHRCESVWLENYTHNNPTNPIPSDRVSILATHIPYHSLPESIVKACSRPVVYVCRNPKDNLVSYWHYINKARNNKSAMITLEDAFEMFCKGISPYGPYWDHVLGYWKASLEHPNKILFMNYEDMKREPVVYAKKLAEFIGHPFSAEEEEQGVVQQVVEFCSFENLSGFDVNKRDVAIPLTPTITVWSNIFFRKGEVGDYKNYLTEEMIARLDAITEEKFKEFGLQLPA